MSDVRAAITVLGGGEAECFLIAEGMRPDRDALAALRPGETREIDVPAGAAVLVRVDAPGGSAWRSVWAADAPDDVVHGEFRDGRGGGLIIAPRGGAKRVRVTVEAAE